MKRVGFIRLKDDGLIERIERYKNILRLLSRVIDILVFIVELYYIQKEIDHLVSTHVLFIFLVNEIKPDFKEQTGTGFCLTTEGTRD